MKNRATSVLSPFLALSFFHLIAGSSYGAEVVMGEYGFTPKIVEIKVGETVTWINKGDLYHSAERGENCISADDEKFSSYSLWPVAKKAGEKFEMVFDKPGTYKYYCRAHCTEENMVGTVIVN